MQAESAASCPFSGGARSRPPVQQSARADSNRRRSIWTHSHVWPRAPLEALVAAGRGCFSRLRPLRSLSLSRCCGRGRGWIDKWCVLSSAAALSEPHTLGGGLIGRHHYFTKSSASRVHDFFAASARQFAAEFRGFRAAPRLGTQTAGRHAACAAPRTWDGTSL
jgi:hypothetical protein